MKQHKVSILIFTLAILVGITAWLHLSSRQEVAGGTVLVTADGQTNTVQLDGLHYEPVSGIRVNGKGESISVEGEGISLKDLLESRNITSYSSVRVISDDSYWAELTVEEIRESGKACLLLEDDTLRLVVFGDENSRRSVSNVVEIIVD